MAYAALATNICTGEVGLSLEYGGGSRYPSHAVGFYGDGVLYTTTTSEFGTDRYGDYVSIRQQPLANPNLFDAFGYSIRRLPPPISDQKFSDVHYVSFGRPFSACALVAADDRGSAEPPGLTKPSAEREGSIHLTQHRGGSGFEISFVRTKPGRVQLDVYDIGGRLVRRLEGTYSGGRNTIHWDGTDGAGDPAASGIYLFRLNLGSSMHSAKGILMR